MRKLTRKITISLFAALFTLISLGAITFAWFTLTTVVEVEEFEEEIYAGEGIEVSLDGLSFTSYLRSEAINKQIKANLGVDKITLDAVTTANGFSDFKLIKMGDTPTLEPAPFGKWVWFNLYFRTPQENTYIYLLDDTYITSNGKRWRADVDFYDILGGTMDAGDSKIVYASNSVRMSFANQKIDKEKLYGEQLHPIGSDDEIESVVIYELNPRYPVSPKANEKNNRLDKSIKSYGLVDYYRMKTGGREEGVNLSSYFNNDVLPAKVYDNKALVTKEDLQGTEKIENAEAILMPSTLYDNYYYGAIKVQVWLEGWDPDCYNTILSSDVKIKLSFGSSLNEPGKESTTIDHDSEIKINYVFAEEHQGAIHTNPSAIKQINLPLFLNEATLPGYKFVGWYRSIIDGEYSQPISVISKAETAKEITLYARFVQYKIEYDLGSDVESMLSEDRRNMLLHELPKAYNGSNISLPLADLGIQTLIKDDETRVYEFKGWYLNASLTGQVITVIDNNISQVPGDLKLYADWVELVEIDYVLDGEIDNSHANPRYILRDYLPLSLLDAEFAGYQFSGWFINEDFSGSPITLIPTNAFGKITLYGYFIGEENEG